VTHLPPTRRDRAKGGLLACGWTPGSHPLRCCTHRPGAGVGWTPTVVRLGAPCRRRLGTPLRRAPTDLAGWVIEAKRLRVAPCTETRIRSTVRLSRSRVSDSAIRLALLKHPTVICCTVNKAFASFRVGELRLKGLRVTPSGWRGHTAKGYGLTLKQDREGFFRSGGRHRRTSTDASLYTGGGQDGNPSPEAGSKTVFSGTGEPR